MARRAGLPTRKATAGCGTSRTPGWSRSTAPVIGCITTGSRCFSTCGSTGVYVVAFAVLCAALEIFSSYQRYTSVLKWLTLSLFAYVATVLVVRVPWGEVAYRTLVPSVVWQKDYVVTIVAVLGTTISPYLFFWQASEEAEDERVNPAEHPLTEAPNEAPAQIERIEIDTYLGMGLSNFVSFCIIVTTGATLNLHGV